MKNKIPLTVVSKNRLYVRKTLTLGGKRKQIWRVCEPPTERRAREILMEIEAEILSGADKDFVELARIFLSVKNGEIEFSEFKNSIGIINKTQEKQGF